MHYTQCTRQEFLYKIGEITDCSISSDEIRNAVSGYGYDKSRLKEGRELWEGLKLLHVDAQDKIALKRKCYAVKRQLQGDIHKVYMKYLKLARIAFVNNLEAQEALMLNGARGRKYEKWHTQVLLFVNNMLSNQQYIKSMAIYGVKENDIEGLHEKMLRLNKMYEECVRIRASVRMLNEKIKYKTLDVQRWVSSYLKVAKIALEENPEVLAILGIGAKN
jgi:hypothetical protein